MMLAPYFSKLNGFDDEANKSQLGKFPGIGLVADFLGGRVATDI
jgi:hypothetical protein